MDQTWHFLYLYSVMRGCNRGSLSGFPPQKYYFSGFPQTFFQFSVTSKWHFPVSGQIFSFFSGFPGLFYCFSGFPPKVLPPLCHIWRIWWNKCDIFHTYTLNMSIMGSSLKVENVVCWGLSDKYKRNDTIPIIIIVPSYFGALCQCKTWWINPLYMPISDNQ